MKDSKKIEKELKKIARKNNGILKPENVLLSAEPKDSPLHSCFTWDDTKAGHEYRLWQARQLIRCTVIFEDSTEKSIRAFVSLSSDRKGENYGNGGGYREMIMVLKNQTNRTQMLEDALAELQVFERKYQMLTELSSVFEAAAKLRSSL